MAEGMILAAGVDVRELRLEVRFLQRQPELLREARSADELLAEIAASPPGLVVLGSEFASVEQVSRVRGSELGRGLSLLVVVPSEDPPGIEGVLLDAGANAALRRPLERFVLESWVGKLLDVPRRVLTRIPVHVQVVGSRRKSPGEHFYGLTRNLSVHGMLLASPVRIDAEDVDLELDLPEPEGRVRVLGRVVREAPEVGWPYVGYGIEFLFLPEGAQAAVQRMVRREADVEAPRSLWAPGAIHSTFRRSEWIYEVSEPARTDSGFLVEIRRSERAHWRPGRGRPCHVVRANDARAAVEAAREFVRRHG
jgi:hypothetical protein